MKKIKENGFSITTGLLILVVASSIIGVGYYAYRQTKTNNNSNNNQRKSAVNTKPAIKDKKADETAEWLLYENPKNNYSVRLPDGWIVHRYQKENGLFASDVSDITYVKGSVATVIEDDGGRDFNSVAFSLNYIKAGEMTKLGVKQSTIKTVDGIEVEKYKKTVDTEPEVMGPPKGTEQYFYFIKSAGYEIVIQHDVLPGATPQIELIEKVVKTVHFK